MAFVCLGILELVHSFNIKSEQSIFKMKLLDNKYLLGAFFLGIVMQVGVVLVPKIASIFKLVPLNLEQWMFTLGISILPIIIMEIQKKFNEFKFGKVIYKEQLTGDGIK